MRLRPLLALGLAGLLAALATAPVAAQEATTPVVVAVDTSRSLSPADLRRAGERLADTVGRLDAATPVGLLAFDDEPRWVVAAGSTPAAVAAALPDLQPRGDYTLLNDALFTATRALPEGGVVLLVSDGRDERSAVTVDDIARRSEATDVRVLALGVGRRMAPLALRRLALVTDGRYLGLLDEADAADVAAAVATSRGEVAAARTERAPSPVAPPPPADAGPAATAATTDPATSGEPPSGRIHPGWLGALAAIAVVAAVAFLLARRRRAGRVAATCERCGEELPADGEACRRCGEERLHGELAGRPAVDASEVREVSSDTVVFDPPEDPDALEKTRVLTELAVLLVRRRGEETRAFVLPPGRAFSVGRAAGNSLAIADGALSAQHFKIVPEDGRYYVVDLGSTNGTWVDGERVTARELPSGTVLRAGQVELELKSKTEPLRA